VTRPGGASHRPTGSGRLILPALSAALAVAAAGGLGYSATIRQAGPDAVPSLLAGCAVGVAANWAGLLSLWFSGFADPARRATAVLMATGVRFLAVLVFALAAVFCGWFLRGPLLIWTAISYVLGLLVETVWLVHVSRGRVESDA